MMCEFSGDMTAASGGSLALVHGATLDSLRVHWPELMSLMQVGGQNTRGGRLAFLLPFLFNTLNMHYWSSNRLL